MWPEWYVAEEMPAVCYGLILLVRVKIPQIIRGGRRSSPLSASVENGTGRSY